MKQCRVPGNKPYPSGCEGWSKEAGGYKCLNCPFYKDRDIDITPHYEQPVPHVPKMLFGTWSRQFVKTKIDERE